MSDTEFLKERTIGSLVVVDTGERRYPTKGEHYCWISDADSEFGPGVHGPFTCYSDMELYTKERMSGWAHPPECYAIYREVVSE